MKKERIIFMSLLLFLAAACFLLLQSATKKQASQGSSQDWDPQAMHVICPKLSESADAFLILDGRHKILMDTGVANDTETILSTLRQYEVDHLDALILTHYDKDHIGGAAGILKEISVDKCYMPCGKENSDEYAALSEALENSGAEQIIVSKSMTVQNEDSSYTIYPPLEYSYPKNNDNNRSLIITFAHEGKHLLFTGDAQKTRINEYLKSQFDKKEYDFVKIPHHGRNENSVSLLLKNINPSLALITSSEEEPADEGLVKLLEEAGTDLAYPKEGTVILQVAKDHVCFLPERME